MKMPNPIAIRFAKLIFSILSITVLGVIFAMISHDHKLLILSAGVAITGGVKACSFYRQVSRTSVSRDCLSKSRSIFIESATPLFWSWRMEATYSGFWMDDINSKLEAYIDFTSKNRPMISRISRRPFSRPRLYLALKNSLFLQASRFRYSGMCIIGMLCLQCSLLDVFSSGSFLRCEPVSFTQAY